jgi:hypothetical protein
MMWPQRILSSALSRRAKLVFESPARIRCFYISTPSDTSSAPALTKLNRREADMLADIDYSNLPKFPQKLAENLSRFEGEPDSLLKNSCGKLRKRRKGHQEI